MTRSLLRLFAIGCVGWLMSAASPAAAQDDAELAQTRRPAFGEPPRPAPTAPVTPGTPARRPAFNEPPSQPPTPPVQPGPPARRRAFNEPAPAGTNPNGPTDIPLAPAAEGEPAEMIDADEPPPAPDDAVAKLQARLEKLESSLKKSKEKEEVKAQKAKWKPSVNFTGELQVDAVFADQTEENRAVVGDIDNGADIRRARLGAFGEWLDNYEYRLEWDFALAGRPSFLDNWITIRDVPFFGSVRVGHFFEPFLLDRLTSNRFTTFMQRALPDAFAPARNLGIMAFDETEDFQHTWQYGVFRTGSNDFGDDVGDSPDTAVTARTTWAPGYHPDCPDDVWHFGIAGSHRMADDRTVRFTSTPELRNREDSVGSFPNFVDTGVLRANSFDLAGFEFARVWGSFSVQSEYVITYVDRVGGDNATFQSGYVFASYFLTGEHRTYSHSTNTARHNTGTFDRVLPKTNFLPAPGVGDVPCGPGAWEVAARYSWIDLNDSGVTGGELHDVTLGLNWYLNPYTKVMWNYIHPMLERGGPGTTTADLYGMRCQFEF